MDHRRLDLGQVDAVDAESFGAPGSRTFRIQVRTGSGTVSMWLEKHQVMGLGAAIEQTLQRASGSPVEQPAGEPVFRGELEVRVGSLGLAYNPEQKQFLVQAGEFESPFDIEAIAFATSRAQMGSLLKQINGIVAAGRPTCPLCGRALMNEAHFCPESNGHAHLSQEQ